jgi:hypothetical protein
MAYVPRGGSVWFDWRAWWGLTWCMAEGHVWRPDRMCLVIGRGPRVAGASWTIGSHVLPIYWASIYMYLQPWALFNYRKPRPPTDQVHRLHWTPIWLIVPNCLRQIIIRVMMMCVLVYANIVCARSGYLGPQEDCAPAIWASVLVPTQILVLWCYMFQFTKQ